MTARHWILVGVVILAIIGLLLTPPFAQHTSYHNFADKRTLLGIPYFGDVLSNLPFLVVGLIGVNYVRKQWHSTKVFCGRIGKWQWLLLFVGVALVSAGSAYYHWNPNNETLVWDRLPMTLGFMSFLAAILTERVSLRIGGWLTPLLIALGFFSVWYWHHTEQLGHGDLRVYGAVHFLSSALILLTCLLFRARHKATKYVFIAIVIYMAGRIPEHFDAELFDLSGRLLSGHTLKHFVAAAATCFILQYLHAQHEG